MTYFQELAKLMEEIFNSQVILKFWQRFKKRDQINSQIINKNNFNNHMMKKIKNLESLHQIKL